jgi:cyclophilin family peptidyl-prolyl cis-trans isomerase
VANDGTGQADETQQTERRPRRGPLEPEPEPSIRPGSLSRTLGHVALTVIAVLVLYTAYQHSRREDDDPSGSRADAEETTPGTSEDDVTTTTAVRGPSEESTCPPEDAPSEPVRRFEGAPPMCIDPARTYVATVETTRGNFEITLDSQAAPVTVNNFVFLAGWRFYEGAAFYRVVPGLSVGTGDPVAQNGTGDPGYTIEDELPTAAPFYPVMSVRMTNRGEPNTNESEFSIVTGPAAETAGPARYSRFGRVTAGEDVVREIEGTGDPNSDSGVPLEETVIDRITIEERGAR